MFRRECQPQDNLLCICKYFRIRNISVPKHFSSRILNLYQMPGLLISNLVCLYYRPAADWPSGIFSDLHVGVFVEHPLCAGSGLNVKDVLVNESLLSVSKRGFSLKSVLLLYPQHRVVNLFLLLNFQRIGGLHAIRDTSMNGDVSEMQMNHVNEISGRWYCSLGRQWTQSREKKEEGGQCGTEGKEENHRSILQLCANGLEAGKEPGTSQSFSIFIKCMSRDQRVLNQAIPRVLGRDNMLNYE